ncbi:MAG: hypothetical protein N4A45_04620 [Flavobacteriales bacterium]|jgi:hypothetical protein|nr:hypothetical protein [Flavobacteriales bacterium]
MKKTVFALAALATLSIVSCEEDKKDDDKKDEVTVDANNFKGTFTKKVTLDASKTYKLTGAVVVEKGGELVIPAGTVIEATGGTASYIAVAAGGKMDAQGTASNPIVMTSGKAVADRKAGDWGGLVICGEAPTNKGATALSEVGNLKYGGTKSNDNSGTYKYIRVEYTGATFGSDKEFNGVSLFGVGSGTTFEYIQSYNGGDDGIEFFGGTVDGKYLVSTNSGDDAIDFADGWSGKGMNWYIIGGKKAGIEGSNNGDNGDANNPMTNATLENISIVKGNGDASEGGIYLKEGAGKWSAKNIYIKGYELGIKSKSSDANAIARIEGGDINLNPIQFDGVAKKQSYTGTATYFTEGNNSGAGNGADLPSWAQGWTK